MYYSIVYTIVVFVCLFCVWVGIIIVYVWGR